MVGTHAWTVMWVKKVSCGGVFDLAVEQPVQEKKIKYNQINIISQINQIDSCCFPYKRNLPEILI